MICICRFWVVFYSIRPVVFAYKRAQFIRSVHHLLKMSSIVAFTSRQIPEHPTELVKEADGYTLKYTLQRPLTFDRPYFARLLYCSPKTSHPYFVYPDFVRSQLVFGREQTYLGCSSPAALNPFLPVAINSVPSTGFIRIVSIDGSAPLLSSLTLVIEFAPEDIVLNGASSTTRQF